MKLERILVSVPAIGGGEMKSLTRSLGCDTVDSRIQNDNGLTEWFLTKARDNPEGVIGDLKVQLVQDVRNTSPLLFERTQSPHALVQYVSVFHDQINDILELQNKYYNEALRHFATHKESLQMDENPEESSDSLSTQDILPGPDTLDDISVGSDDQPTADVKMKDLFQKIQKALFNFKTFHMQIPKLLDKAAFTPDKMVLSKIKDLEKCLNSLHGEAGKAEATVAVLTGIFQGK